MLPFVSVGQNYTAYRTGNSVSVVTSPLGGICLMGGATEHDEAMKWFLQRAAGGDVLVLRASGSDGYNDYLFNQLGIVSNSVESIVCHNALSANENYIHQRIEEAEAIWFAGGDQWNYISYWRNTKVDSLINDGLLNRNLVIGGTSAGMAIQGGVYYSAENGSVTSTTALSNPYDFSVTPDSTAFLKNTLLQDVITDTHYDNPDRKGRHVVFLSRMFEDYDMNSKGIACDEYTAVCIAPDGEARVFGEYPSYDDNAYFIQVNCELADPSPENCTSGQALTWNRNQQALVVYQVKGDLNGSKTFNLNDWKTGNGGTWMYWYVDNGILYESAGVEPACASLLNETALEVTEIFPNPVSDKLYFSKLLSGSITIIDPCGRILMKEEVNESKELNIHFLEPGTYQLLVQNPSSVVTFSFVKTPN